MPNTTDNPDKTPWKPLSFRERLYYAIVRFLTVIFRVDFFDVYRRQEVTWDERDEIYRMQMRHTEDFKDEFLETYKRQCKFYDDNDDNDWVHYTMWLVMRSDSTINPPVTISGERNNRDGFDVEFDSGSPEHKKRKRKAEIFEDLDNTGFINPMIRDTKDP